MSGLHLQVYIIHRRNEFRASKVMQKRALEHEKIKVSEAHSCLARADLL